MICKVTFVVALLVFGPVAKVVSEEFRNTTQSSQTNIAPQGRTFFYDDHQIFFTMMVYFPFVVNKATVNFPLEAPPSSARSSVDSKVVSDVVVEGASVHEQNVAPEEEHNDAIEFSRRSLEPTSAQDTLKATENIEDSTDSEVKSRSKRTLYIDDQVINLFLCMSLPFSVPLLRYDEDLIEAYKNKKARKEHEKLLPLIPTHDEEFVSNYNDDDTYGDEELIDDGDFTGRTFGSTSKKTPVAKHDEEEHNRKRPYLETVFQPISSLVGGSGRSSHQLWSATDPAKSGPIGRSASGYQDTASALASTTLVGVDSRVVDLIDSYPESCTQQVLCRVGRSLTEASPVQALLLQLYKGNVFGFNDDASHQALDSALDGDSCETLFPCQSI